ncbi:A/G-specific adenine glycosylase [Halomonas urumqiensis]|uniref:Adenine DNA glycosylase n=1 Tax=Halomonas urumqiensis TaxID=1684789 RepID=A0A2N7ULA1_9GAMM|nr:A/G-specific adenine glycosylase [Halomonas urumqiensis]PMR81221.1 A/G-specific adenine glycosylase [Halomonas urumqiensis]PTB01768.1 adenine DNA glycosylase [Halomonas urumqiensis]GHE22127.1 A/G-specific adenine glycosylase [Halomonas urumqiensis]
MKELPAPVLAPADFQQRLLGWFDKHGRHDLPWQRDRTPYRVWVSEIMLQQTQVTTVIPYFERFMARFPDVGSLASAQQDEVLHLWTGLGYYARGRNLHKAAQVIVDKHGGELPQTLEALAELPGIGRSTAGAIIAQSRGQRAVILDGNVKRSLSRLHAVPGWPGRPAVERTLWALAEHFTPQERLADYTQAMMDFGATLCRRGAPDCPSCPFNDVCVAHARGETRRFPESKPKKALPTRTTLMLMLCDNRGRVLLEQRPATGLWGGLWSLPQFDDDESLRAWLDQHAPGSQLDPPQATFTHVFSHFRMEITPQSARVERLDSVGEARRWYDPAQPDRLGLAAPVKALLTSLAPFSLTAAPGP